MWQKSLNRLRLTIFAASLVSCSPGQSISDEDGSSTLKAAVKMIARSRKLPANACISANLEAAGGEIPGKEGDGWIRPEGSHIAYRLLRGPKINRLPPEVAAVIPMRMRDLACDHHLVIHLPQYFQTIEAGHETTVAFVNISDRCPLCGGGYQIMFIKTGEHWKAEQSDLQTTWIS